MRTPAKELLFKTAFSPMHQVRVKIDHAHQDSLGVWIFTCRFDYEGKHYDGYLFRPCELTDFVL